MTQPAIKASTAYADTVKVGHTGAHDSSAAVEAESRPPTDEAAKAKMAA
jgi:hypothetical protein